MKVVTIGRDPHNDVLIEDPLVSRFHVKIMQGDDGSIILEDLGSKNGTYVNGEKVDRARLFNLDVVRIGNTKLPWHSYFSTTETIIDSNNSNNSRRSEYSNNDYGYSRPNNSGNGERWADNGNKPTNSNGLLVFLMGLAALGIDAYLVIRFYNEVSILHAGSKSWMLFPAYLKYGSNWGWMIGALVLGIVAKFIERSSDGNEDRLSSAGVRLGGIAVTFSIIFMVLAIFADPITEEFAKQYVKQLLY